LRRAAIESRVSLYWPAPRNTRPENATSIRLVAPASNLTGRRLATSLNDVQQEGLAPRGQTRPKAASAWRSQLKPQRSAYAHASTSTCDNLGKTRLLASLPAAICCNRQFVLWRVRKNIQDSQICLGTVPLPNVEPSILIRRKFLVEVAKDPHADFIFQLCIVHALLKWTGAFGGSHFLRLSSFSRNRIDTMSH
jgi:hypothetical protein